MFWHGIGAEVDFSRDSRSLAFCLHGASQGDDDIYVMINAYWCALEFEIQEGTAEEWRRIADTALPSPDDFSESGVPLDEMRYTVGPRSDRGLIAAPWFYRKREECASVSNGTRIASAGGLA